MSRPNILMFLPDGMQAEPLLPGHPCRTPHFDRLASRGLRFRRAHCPLPTCSPSRASLMTGLLPHNHGVLQVEHCVDDDQSVLRTGHRHWAQNLSGSGYRTGYFGKWHIERTGKVEDFGWQIDGTDLRSSYRALGQGPAEGEGQLIADDGLLRYKEGPPGYRRVLHYGVTDVPPERRPIGIITSMAQEFLSQALGRAEPWACCVSFSEPNTPLVAGRGMVAAYDVDKTPLPGNLKDDLAGRPAIYRRVQRVYQDMTERAWRELRTVYYALITELDEQFGRLVQQIASAGQLDNTVVVVVSDHGRYMGGHGFDAHNFGAFEEIYNIPLIMAGPGIASGKETSALVGFHDLGPTLLELAGAEPIQVPDSRSFAPVLGDPAGQERQFNQGYAESHGTRYLLTQRILWQGPWKFVFNGFDEDELYNLDEDPHELANLASRPEYQDRVLGMMTEIWRVMRRTGDRALLETHYSPMRFAAVGPLAAD